MPEHGAEAATVAPEPGLRPRPGLGARTEGGAGPSGPDPSTPEASDPETCGAGVPAPGCRGTGSPVAAEVGPGGSETAAGVGEAGDPPGLDLTAALAALPTERLVHMQAAAGEVAECHRVLANAGLSVVGELLRGQGDFVVDRHYPEGDVYDRTSHAQYYYHAHREGEHGHFHCFLRAPGLSAQLRPDPEPSTRGWPAGADAIAHLVAIGMDRRGFARRLFVTNRWVTGETWYPADAVIGMLDRFEIDHAYPNWATNRWLTAMLRLFRPQIEALLVARDRRIAQWQAAHPCSDVFEDRRLEAVCEIGIDMVAQARAVAAALATRG